MTTEHGLLVVFGRLAEEIGVRETFARVPIKMKTIDHSSAEKVAELLAHILAEGMHYDPLLSSGRKLFFSFGHVWVVLALWVPFPMGERRGFALPTLIRLYVGRNGAAGPMFPHSGSLSRG